MKHREALAVFGMPRADADADAGTDAGTDTNTDTNTDTEPWLAGAAQGDRLQPPADCVLDVLCGSMERHALRAAAPAPLVVCEDADAESGCITTTVAADALRASVLRTAMLPARLSGAQARESRALRENPRTESRLSDMPVPTNVAYFEALRQAVSCHDAAYFVGAKSDGDRYMLCVGAERGTYAFIGRASPLATGEVLRCVEAAMADHALPANTLLDGELLQRRRDDGALDVVYVVFDVYVYAGKATYLLDFRARRSTLGALARLLAGAVHTAWARFMTVKAWHRVTELNGRWWVSRRRGGAGHGAGMGNAELRVHAGSDGAMRLTPPPALHPVTAAPLPADGVIWMSCAAERVRKAKQPHHQTVDMVLSGAELSLYTYAFERGRRMAINYNVTALLACSAALHRERQRQVSAVLRRAGALSVEAEAAAEAAAGALQPLQQLQRGMAQLALVDSPELVPQAQLLELRLDAEGWTVVRRRADKTLPNTVNVAMATLLARVEHLMMRSGDPVL